MNRQRLIDQVKAEYAQLADIESKESYTQGQFGNMTPEGYYEMLLGKVIAQIETGAFDDFAGGREIVEAVANNRDKWGLPL